jgi:S-(hydroxymethyl)mycothiol dehydrogenase
MGMGHQVRGVIARSAGTPVELVTVLVPDPGPGEALVRVQACGVCHTDLHYREGAITDEFPFLLARRSRSTRPPDPRRRAWSAAGSWPGSGRS